MTIFCSVDAQEINETIFRGQVVYTSGLGGIFSKDVEIGFISAINRVSFNETEILITLKANPLNEIFYGVIGKEADEI